MCIFRVFKNFIMFPLDPSFIKSREQRLNIRLADSSKKIHLIEKSVFEQFGDEFEAMEINEFGDVILWTKKKVWHIHKNKKMEKLLYLPRNPEDG